jgi:hypothetical protein
MLKVYHARPNPRPQDERYVYRDGSVRGTYEGWVGQWPFGVIWPHRYYGWRVTCSAEVMAEFYGHARISPFFTWFDEAVGELERLMNIAEHIDHFAMFEGCVVADWKPRPPDQDKALGLPEMGGDIEPCWRMPHSPAQWRNLARWHRWEINAKAASWIDQDVATVDRIPIG